MDLIFRNLFSLSTLVFTDSNDSHFSPSSILGTYTLGVGRTCN